MIDLGDCTFFKAPSLSTRSLGNMWTLVKRAKASHCQDDFMAAKPRYLVNFLLVQFDQG